MEVKKGYTSVSDWIRDARTNGYDVMNHGPKTFVAIGIVRDVAVGVYYGDPKHRHNSWLKINKESNPVIPKKMLAWRETKRKGSIMRPSTFKKIVRKAKDYADPLAVAGTAYWKTLKAKYRDRKKSNPPKGAVKIYDQIDAIEATKGPDSLWPNQPFRHDFKGKTKAEIFGLPDGSLLVKSKTGKPLHKLFNYPEKRRG